MAHRICRVEERAAGIFHEMPAVRNLNGVWQSLGRGAGISTAAVARDDLHSTCGCSESHACAVTGPLSGSSRIGRRRSRSQGVVPYR